MRYVIVAKPAAEAAPCNIFVAMASRPTCCKLLAFEPNKTRSVGRGSQFTAVG